jgi:hypothetical protein
MGRVVDPDPAECIATTGRQIAQQLEGAACTAAGMGSLHSSWKGQLAQQLEYAACTAAGARKLRNFSGKNALCSYFFQKFYH